MCTSASPSIIVHSCMTVMWSRSGPNYVILVIILLAGMAVFFIVAGYLIEERRIWPINNASPRGQSSK